MKNAFAALAGSALLLLPGLETTLRAQDTIVWDYGPSTGLSAGGCAMDQQGFQTLQDSVSFSRDTGISGYNLFTVGSALPLAGDQYRVRFFSDAGGLPGSVYQSLYVTGSDPQFVGNFSDGLIMVPVYQINLRFPEVTLLGATTYWVEACSVGFDVGTDLVKGPGDGAWSDMNQDQNPYLVRDGGYDMMFQLVSVPEPSTFLLLLPGLAAVTIIRRQKSSR